MTHLFVGYKMAHRTIADVWAAVAVRHHDPSRDFLVEDDYSQVLANSPEITEFNWNDPNIGRIVMPDISVNRTTMPDGSNRFTLLGSTFLPEYQTITDLQSKFQVRARGYEHDVLDALADYRPLKDFADYVSADILRSTPNDLAVYRAAVAGRRHRTEAAEWQG